MSIERPVNAGTDVPRDRPRGAFWQTAVLCKALLLAILLVAGAETVRTALGSNFHTVVPRRCYRCAQPRAEDLRLMVQALGIRTIVNLRGTEDLPWYEAESAMAQRLGLRLADAGIWARRAPTEDEFRGVFQAVDDSTEPVLIHCVSGIDRTGLASALFLLLRTNATVEEACGQLSPRFGHNPWGLAACQDRVLNSYAAWLAENGLSHEPDHLRHWCREVYRQEPGAQ
jgi:protein tyrosine/serine phosphatase